MKNKCQVDTEGFRVKLPLADSQKERITKYMMKNLNYKIQDWFEHDKFGVIVSIASPELDRLSDDEIKNLVGDQVAILNSNSDEKKWAKVFKTEIASSIVDKKNVSVCLGNSVKLSNIKPNSNLILSKEILV